MCSPYAIGMAIISGITTGCYACSIKLLLSTYLALYDITKARKLLYKQFCLGLEKYINVWLHEVFHAPS